MDALNKQEREIELAVSEAKLAEKLEKQRLQNQWDADCNSFLDQHKDTYDFNTDAGKEVFAHLNETIIAFAKMPRNANLSGPELLDKAHKAVMLERGMPVADTPKPAAKPAKATAPKPTLPPDMSRLPAATSNDPGEGRWASLDKLAETNPAGYEAALAKMSDAERDEYLKV